MKKYIDLHVHTNYSDGVNTPLEVLNMAIENETKYISICDHNTIEGNIEARKIISENNLDIEIIKGVEIDANYKNKLYDTIHILAYNCNDNLINEYFKELNERNVKSFYETFNFLKENFNDKMDLEEFNKIYNISSRPLHRIMDYLMYKGFVDNRHELYEKYKIENIFDDVEDVVTIINKCGGVAVMAHPTRYEKVYNIPREEISELVLNLKNKGLRGVEAIYSKNSDEQTKYWKKFAEDNDLIYTCGSDFHQIAEPERPVKIEISKGNCGNMYITDEEIIVNLKNEF